MKTLFLHGLFAAVLAFTATHGYGQDANADIYGTWKVKALVGGGIGSRSQRQVDKVIGTLVVIGPTRFVFNGQACADVHYQRSREETDHYFDVGWRTDVSDIHLPNPVTAIEMGCNIFLFPIRKDHLMIADNSDFFETVRVRKASLRPATHSRP